METFLLVAWIYAGDGQFKPMRTPGLKEIDCHLRAMRVERVRGQTALCIMPVVDIPVRLVFYSLSWLKSHRHGAYLSVV